MNPPDSTDPFTHGLALNDEGMDLRERFQATGSDADLDAAIETVRRAEALVDAGGSGGTAHGTVLSNLGSMLATKAYRTGRQNLLEEGVVHLRRAVACAAETAHDRAARSANLGQALAVQASLNGDPTTLTEGLTLLEEALRVGDPDDPVRAVAASAYAMGLRVRAELTGEPAHPAGEVPDPYTMPDTLADDADPDQVAAVLANVGLARLQSADPAERETAIAGALDLAARAVRAMTPARADSAITASHLVTLALRHYHRTGRLSELDRAVALGDALTDRLPAGLRPMLLVNMALALDLRSRRSASRADATRAVALCERAAQETADSPQVAATVALNHAICLENRWRLTDDPHDLVRARRILTRVAGTVPAPALRGHAAMNLAALHLARAEHTAEQAEQARTAPAGSGVAGRVARRASRLYRTILSRLSAVGDIDHAIGYATQAAAELPTDWDGYGTVLLNLARAHVARWRRDGRPADLEQATDNYRRLVDLDSEAPLRRIVAGQEWGDLAAGTGAWPTAHQAYRRAVTLLPMFATWRADRRDHEFVLGMVSELARDATAAALYAGDPDDAVVLAELGRGVMLNHVTSYHTEFDELARTAPTLAERLRATLSALNEDGVAPPVPDPVPDAREAAEPADPQTDLMTALTDRRHLIDRLTQILDDIRALPGLARFALPPRPADLRAETAEGPVVIVNVSRHRCDALLVGADGVTHVPLPDLRHADVTARARQLLTATTDGDEEMVRAILRWLWATTVGPVLARLGLTAAAVGDRLPRVWWVPTGMLAAMPLHAATDDNHCALDLVVSSFAPTIRSLGHSRRTRTTGLPRRLCLVLPAPDDRSGLPAARREAQRLRERFGADHTDLIAAEAGAATVAAALPGHAWAHFACHARSDLADPSNSRLLLSSATDGALTVERLVRLRADGGELAFLSACETAMSGPHLADEAVHLAAGFLTAGFGQVIATLWAVKDPVARRTTDEVYAALIDQRGHASPVAAADALHRATLATRARYPDAPTAWTAYIHLGR
ncbi:CHAT domain-containing protein [Polymorphospora sp. A560]|uniref:CHAT domain-containing protein n=2 Tax=unclassified Polymorphospora TaxID=2685497 RepID=UPI003892AA04